VPFWLYHNERLYETEQERIFKGPTWCYVGLEAEIPNVGDFVTTYVGDTPVIVNRGTTRGIHAMVNRCAHRGALVRRETRGNARDHVCIYHRWCYNLDGSLRGLPFRQGLKGKGGMSPEFKPADHGLRRLKVESYAGVIFASFRDEAEPLVTYLGPVMTKHLDRIFHKPIRILGYQRQLIRGNWKLYLEDTRDMYHASLLHEFMSTFGINRFTQVGGLKMDRRHRHMVAWSKAGTDDEAEFTELFKSNKVHESKMKLKDPSILKYHHEFDDGVNLSICGIFPSLIVHQIDNSLATRQVRTVNKDEFELYWTLFGFEDDSDEMIRHRLLQANMIGSAGLISLEDAEAIEIAHRASSGDPRACSVIEMGGGGPINDLDFHVNDVACRGFWSYYAELMDIEPEAAVR
jgi:anthranilate 1,2-dioxygenase large subunit